MGATTAALQRCLCGMRNPDRPMAAIMLAGSTGVGKTELAKVPRHAAEGVFAWEAGQQS